MGEKAEALRTKIEDNFEAGRGYSMTLKVQWWTNPGLPPVKTEYVLHENAWSTVGIAVGIGILIGLLMRERD